jgi:hypothetical protein
VLGFLAFLSIVAVAILIAHFTRRADIKAALANHEERAMWGRERDLVIADRPDPSPTLFMTPIAGIDDTRLDPFRDIKFVSQGKSHNFQEGLIEGREAKVFDHREVVSNGKSSYVVERSVVAIRLRENLSRFELRPHKLWDRVTALFGHRDLEIHSPSFDRHFFIAASDPADVIRILDVAIQDRLLVHKHESWHCLNGFLVLIGHGRRSCDELDRMIEDVLWFADRLDGSDQVSF